MARKIEVSDDDLAAIIARSNSFLGVLRALGCFSSEEAGRELVKRIKEGPFSIDHFRIVPGKPKKRPSFKQEWLDRFSKEEFAALIAASKGHNEFCRAAGLAEGATGALTSITEHAAKLGIDVSHFHYLPRSKGFGAGRAISISGLLVKNSKGMSGGSPALIKKLLSHNVFPNECGRCKTGSVWREKPLTMRIIYKNEDTSDLRKENLMLACPNCHDQITSKARSKILRQRHAKGKAEKQAKANGHDIQKPRPLER